eukprot:TRINITY_DN734_c0_g1_i1.p2 TRINITY_DN734_c0_g1~~TRINITY_DN734_c0_g1_i1.p2  ORF type:complete len:308 (+),score=115.26 TRINITY_DN734_c0_g1_i1:62-985(+)
MLSRIRSSVLSRPAARFFSNDLVKNIKTVGVVGAGQMGSGIALVAAMNSGLNVLVMDRDHKKLSESMLYADKILKKSVEKSQITEQEMKHIRARINHVDKLSDFVPCDFVIEAVSENLELKKTIFTELSAITRPHAILASNTSSISITKLGAATDRPDKVIGMHFMNPVPIMKLVEIISGMATSSETLNLTVALAQKMNKTVTQSKDTAGFIANRILMPYINEAVFALQDGVASVEDIDTTMKLGTNVPMGPLTLADFIGLDTCLAIMRVLHTELGDDKYRPCPLLVRYVDAGWLGRKSGRGFYPYK